MIANQHFNQQIYGTFNNNHKINFDPNLKRRSAMLAIVHRNINNNDCAEAKVNHDPDLMRRSIIVHRHVSNDTTSKEIASMMFAAAPAKAVPLAASIEQQPKAANGVPIIVESCLRYFSIRASNCEGLFRVPGNQRLVDQLWNYLENHPCVRLSVNGISMFMLNHPKFTAHEVSSFLKRFIGSICREPVVTFVCYKPLYDLIKQRCPAHLIGEKCKRILRQLLVQSHRALLGRLCNFCLDSVEHVEHTRMNLNALAVCFGFLIRAPPENHCPRKKCRHKCCGGKRKLRMSENKRIEYMMAQAKTAKLNVSIIQIIMRHAQHIFNS